ncbi:Predicted RNA methylase [Faunimonas pinastri]|uniref:Predicted RNA methylase n=1 Tax=Faunimonas pinastri TaxID=1855383 RepID=A0A1H9IAN1_9HYPH|nr:methyltransferase [Faunimonas pinastri]SEQ71475.1 Predicted RNA methylase [Faunimonas pinastri]
MQVAQPVLAVLGRAEFAGNLLKLPGELDRKLYTQVDKVLVAAGGKWSRKAAAHLFAGDARAALEPIFATGKVINEKQELGAFFSPPAVADRVIALAELERGMQVLEPSAGHGALAARALLAGCEVDCIEVNDRHVSMLCSTAYRNVVFADFLKLEPQQIYDRVLMNPPFGRQADIRHVLHAAKFLRAGGRLVAVMSAGVRYRVNRLSTEFRAFVESRDGEFEDLPSDSFRASGTSVSTCLVRFDSDEIPF